MSLASAFAALEASREERPAGAALPRPERPESKTRPAKKLAKSVDPEFEAKKVFVRRDTVKAAWRKWEDAGGSGELSDLVETLLCQYLRS